MAGDDGRWTALAAEARRGDRESFRLLVEGLSRMLVATAYRLVRDWDVAADLTQETWLRVHGRLDRYDPDRPFPAWLRTVHHRLCLDHLRRAAARREDPAPPERLVHLAGPAGGPGQLLAMEQRERDEQLARAMAALPARQRLAFALVDLEGRDRTEAARLLHMSPVTLRTTLHFARRRVACELRRLEVAS